MLDNQLKTSLVKRCSDPIEDFSGLGHTIKTRSGPLTHIDRGGDVLCVAHLDWVRFHKPSFSRRGNTIYCGQLDDRLGAWVALDLLPALGVTTDILLTDSEEVGDSTAQFFDPPKEYNWIAQFDRAGTDLVMYEYDCKSNRELLKQYGYKIGIGSFTDICWLNHLGVSGFNIGVGYYKQHTDKCHAILHETVTNARRFAEFWRDHKDTRIEAPPAAKESRHGYSFRSYPSGSGWGGYNGYDSKWANDPAYDGYDLEFSRIDDEDSDTPKMFDDTFCPACGYWSDNPYHCDTCGESIVCCLGCGEPIAPEDWECLYCGTSRTDCSFQEFVNRFERDNDDMYEQRIVVPFDDDDDTEELDKLVLP